MRILARARWVPLARGVLGLLEQDGSDTLGAVGFCDGEEFDLDEGVDQAVAVGERLLLKRPDRGRGIQHS